MNTSKGMQDIYRDGSDQERETASWDLFSNLDQNLPWFAARRFQGTTLKDAGDGWLLVVKALYKNHHQVCFVGGHSPQDCIISFCYMMVFDLLSWKPDKFRTTRSDEK